MCIYNWAKKVTRPSFNGWEYPHRTFTHGFAYWSITVLQVSASKLKLQDYEYLIFFKEICKKRKHFFPNPSQKKLFLSLHNLKQIMVKKKRDFGFTKSELWYHQDDIQHRPADMSRVWSTEASSEHYFKIQRDGWSLAVTDLVCHSLNISPGQTCPRLPWNQEGSSLGHNGGWQGVSTSKSTFKEDKWKEWFSSGKSHLLIESNKSISLVLLCLLQVAELPVREKNKKITCTANIRVSRWLQ